MTFTTSRASSLLAIAAAAVLSAGMATAFAPLPQHYASSSSRSSTSGSTTRLYISSYKGVSSATSSFAFGGATSIGTRDKGNPEDQVQNYLPAPGAVEARSNLDGTILVSGLVNSADRTDQFLFDLLNHEDSAFEFNKIIAFVNDATRAKKRLLSRSARYTGLLDKLQVVAAEQENALPTLEQLDGVKSWLAYIDKESCSGGDGNTLLQQCQQVAERAQAAPSIENVAILLTQANNLDVTSCQAIVDALKKDDTKTVYTIVAVGEIKDNVPEGQYAYQFESFGSINGTLPNTAVFSRQESYRMITELLQLASGKNIALSFAEVYNVNVTNVRLIKGLREAGYARPQEIDYMIRGGVQTYKDAVEAWKQANPDAAKGYTSDAWWEAEIYQESRRKSAERDAAKEQLVTDERTKEVEKLAKEWAKREYFRQSMAGTAGTMPDGSGSPMTEEAYIKSVWDRAIFEGDLKYRQIRGEVNNPEMELADFKKRQERKQQTMLARAKKELADILDEDNLGGDDLKKKWSDAEKADKDEGDKDNDDSKK